MAGSLPGCTRRDGLGRGGHGLVRRRSRTSRFDGSRPRGLPASRVAGVPKWGIPGRREHRRTSREATPPVLRSCCCLMVALREAKARLVRVVQPESATEVLAWPGDALVGVARGQGCLIPRGVVRLKRTGRGAATQASPTSGRGAGHSPKPEGDEINMSEAPARGWRIGLASFAILAAITLAITGSIARAATPAAPAVAAPNSATSLDPVIELEPGSTRDPEHAGRSAGHDPCHPEPRHPARGDLRCRQLDRAEIGSIPDLDQVTTPSRPGRSRKRCRLHGSVQSLS